MLAMQHTPRPLPLEAFETFNLGNPRHPIMSTSHHHSIEPLHPPIILLLSFLPEGNLPLITDLLYPLNRRVIRHQVLVSLAIHQALDVSPYSLPVAERGVRTMEVDGELALFGRERFLAELHGDGVDVGFQVRIDGGFGEARLFQLGRQGGESVWDGNWRVGGAVSERGEAGERLRAVVVTNPGYLSVEDVHGRVSEENSPASSRSFTSLKHTDETKCPFLSESINGDGAGRPRTDHGHPLDGLLCLLLLCPGHVDDWFM